mmetsp:Transcript_40373/g.127044  ORF Transcript_40373/g.127044 Transcript_40373/m.127044 type:complete len:629 (-) Transcript_40373:140-2026(-)
MRAACGRQGSRRAVSCTGGSMADVRFLRHLRDNNMQKTMLFKGKKMTREEVLQESLAKAKDQHDTLLARMNQLTKRSSSNKDRLSEKNARFQWIAECGRLTNLSSALAKETDRIMANLVQKATSRDDQCELEEVRRGMEGIKTDALQDQQNYRQILGGVKHMIDAALHSKRSDRETLKGRKAQIEEEISSLRTFHLHKLELLQEEEEELTRRVQEAVRAVSAQEAEARVEQESLQNEQLDALRELRYQGSDKLMFELFQRICQIDQDYVDKLKGNNEEEKRLNKTIPDSQHEKFVKVYKEVTSGVKGYNRGKLLQRLKSEIPECSIKQLDAHIDCFEKRKFLANRRSALQRAWLTARDEAIKWAVESFQSLEELERSRLLAQAETEELGQRRAEIRSRLEVLRQRKEEEEAERRLREEEEERRRVLLEEQLLGKQTEERMRQKESIAAYRQRKAREEEMRFILRIFMLWRSARQNRLTTEKNAVRVGIRIKEYKRKIEERKEIAAQQQLERDLQLERLERLKATVAPVVDADPARVVAPTLAAQAHVEGLANGEKETGTRMFAVQEKNFYSGYTIDRLMQDTRHRLAVALHEAGLDGTSAARDAMMTVKGTLVPRRDMFTSEQLSMAT